MDMDQDNDGLLKVEELLTRLKEVHARNPKEFFVQEPAETGKRIELDYEEVEKQVKENIGKDVNQLEFTDFIIAAIDESVLKDNNRLADAFKYFDRRTVRQDQGEEFGQEDEGQINAAKLLKSLNKCECTSSPRELKRLNSLTSGISIMSC